MSMNLNDLYEIFFIITLSTLQKKTLIIIKVKYLTKQVNNFICMVLYMLYIFKCCV